MTNSVVGAEAVGPETLPTRPGFREGFLEEAAFELSLLKNFFFL